MAPIGLTHLGSQLPWKDEKRTASTEGLTAVPETEALVPPSSNPSPAPEFDPTVGAKPYSPFYRHATLPHSATERLTVQTKDSTLHPNSVNDIEIGADPFRSSADSGVRRGSKLWKQKKRHCDWLRGLTKGQKMAVKGVIAILTVGTMVAIALGITAAVGGGVWKSDHQQGAIGS
ncbi:hypothetical protein BDV29DRAFT_43510 [Aspergillus leporis]|jgi:hypothetical protein|uniref:Uncharacterized protein n=1 Tax=Aspergillus leporis TaxID=41062 RepID=A0A5N5WNP3_9EURO|nr:hypothetical protein BDV29DRAFT_43510 [Aspergillus leporis]